MLIGCHPKNTTNSIFNTIKEGILAGSNIVQIFLKSPHKSTDHPNLTNHDYHKISEYILKKHNIGLYVHASYLLNFCRKPPPSRRNQWAVDSLLEDLKILSVLGGKAVTFHVGKFIDLPFKQALNNFKKSVEYVLELGPKNVELYIETPASIGTETLVKLEDMSKFFLPLNEKYSNFKICVDICHIFVAGYPVHTIKGMKAYFDKFDKLIGLDKLGLIHLNDSTYELGSRKDRHAELTEGFIFKDIKVLKYLIDFANKNKIPMILETHINYDDQIKLVKRLHDQKAGAGSPELVRKILYEMSKIHEYLGDTHRRNAYLNTLWILKDKDLNKLEKIKGIDKILGKIREILKTGRLKELDKLKKDPKVRVIIELNQVMGIGPKFAKELYDQGIRKVSDLKKIELNRIQKLGLKYYNDIKRKIPVTEMNLWNKAFKKELKEFKFIIAGSYLRKEYESHDIDLLITSSEDIRESLLEILKKYIISIVSSGRNKLSILVKLDKIVRKLDVLLVPKESYPTALFYMTGNRSFTLQMRSLAKEKGYLLNEFGLYKNGKRVKLENEKDLFRILDVKYLKPEERK